MTVAYSSVEHFWTAERVNELRRLFEGGLSNQQIAVEMQIKSRNAVIGKLHRLGLRRETADGPKTTRSLHVTVPKRVRETKPVLRVVAAPLPVPVPAVLLPRPRDVKPDGVAELAPPICPNRTSLLSARANQCRWPAADDGSATIVCGDLKEGGEAYCLRHFRISVQRPVASQYRVA